MTNVQNSMTGQTGFFLSKPSPQFMEVKSNPNFVDKKQFDTVKPHKADVKRKVFINRPKSAVFDSHDPTAWRPEMIRDLKSSALHTVKEYDLDRLAKSLHDVNQKVRSVRKPDHLMTININTKAGIQQLYLEKGNNMKESIQKFCDKHGLRRELVGHIYSEALKHIQNLEKILHEELEQERGKVLEELALNAKEDMINLSSITTYGTDNCLESVSNYDEDRLNYSM